MLTGCTPPPPSGYSPESVFDGGYGETEVQQNIWNVYYHGTGRFTFRVAESYWLRRCADIAQSRGYAKFAVLRVSEQIGNHSRPLVVEGTMELLNTPVDKDKRKVLDVGAVQAAVSAAAPCTQTGPCTIDFGVIPGAKDIFPAHED
jgi:hypothetical protein